MDTRSLPSLFLSHGSPMIALEPGEAGAFMQRLGPAIDDLFGRPRAIVALSAHTASRHPVVLGAAQHGTVHDFGGFPEALFRVRYDAPGSPSVADEAGALLAAAGIAAERSDEGGLDHGIWSVLRHMYPKADVPIVPIAWVPSATPAAQFALGAALAPLAAQGVLVLGTGSITHNLRLLWRSGGAGASPPEIPESRAFREWIAARAAARDWDALFDYRAQAPHAALMHPTDEHLLPWFSAAGAGGREAVPQRLHESATYGSLGMDAYAYGPEAASLHEAMQGVVA